MLLIINVHTNTICLIRNSVLWSSLEHKKKQVGRASWTTHNIIKQFCYDNIAPLFSSAEPKCGPPQNIWGAKSTKHQQPWTDTQHTQPVSPSSSLHCHHSTLSFKPCLYPKSVVRIWNHRSSPHCHPSPHRSALSLLRHRTNNSHQNSRSTKSPKRKFPQQSNWPHGWSSPPNDPNRGHGSRLALQPERITPNSPTGWEVMPSILITPMQGLMYL